MTTPVPTTRPHRTRAVAAAVASSLLAGVLSLVGAPTATANDGPIELSYPYVRTVVSAATTGGTADGESYGPSISDDGRFVTFTSEATDMGASGGFGTVYLHDRESGDTAHLPVEIEVEGDTIEVPLAGSSQPAISGDGSTIALASYPEGEGDVPTVVTYEIASGAITETALPGTPAYVDAPVISDDGSVVVVAADLSSSLVEGDWHVYAGAVGSTLTEIGTGGDADAPVAVSVSGDGSRAAWQSYDDADGNEDLQGWELFALDLDDAEAEPVAVSDIERGAFAFSNAGSTYGRVPLTDDGDTLVSVVAENHSFRIRRFDLAGDTITFEDYAPFAGEAPAFWYQVGDPAIDADGSTVAFSTFMSVGGDSSGTSPHQQVLVWDEGAETMSVATAAAAGQDAHCPSDPCFGTGDAGLSDDGGVVTFQSDYSDLVDDDENGLGDVFVATAGALSDPPVWGSGATLTVNSITPYSATLSWPEATDDDGVTGYRVHLLHPEAGTIYFGSTTADDRTFELQNLSPDTEWTFGVAARDAQGQLSGHISTTFETLPYGGGGGGGEEPDELVQLVATGLSGDGVKLDWPLSDDDAVTGYQIVRTPQDGSEEVISTVGPTVDTYSDTTGAPGTVYAYRVDRVVSGTPEPHTTDAGYQFPFLHIQTTTWAPATDSYGYVGPGGTIALEVRGSGNRTATATIGYQHWTSPTEVEDLEVTVPLVEQSEKGLYQATWTIPADTAAIASGVFSIDAGDDVGTVQRSANESFPMAIASPLTLSVDVPDGATAAELLAGATVQLYDYSTWTGRTFDMPTGNETLLGLLPSSERYDVRLLDQNGALLAEAETAARAGVVTTLAVAPRRDATLAVTVVDDDGELVPGASVVVTDADDESFARGGYSWNGTTNIYGLREGQDLTVTVRPRAGTPYVAEVSVLGKVVQSGVNELEVVLPQLPRATLSGRVVEAHEPFVPIPWAQVNVTQDVGEQRFTFSTTSDADGAYTLEVLQGTGIEVSGSSYRAPRTVIDDVELGPDGGVVDLPLVTPRPLRFDVDLQVQLDPNQSPTSIAELNWRDAAHYGMYATGPLGTFRVDDEQMTVQGRPGDDVTVCASGGEAGLGRDCDTVELVDPDLAGAEVPVASLLLTKAAELRASIDAEVDRWFAVSVVSVEESGTSHVLGMMQRGGSPFSFGLPGAGTFRLTVTESFGGDGGRAVEVVTVDAGATIDLGAITPVVPSSALKSDGDTAVVAVRPVVVPGGVAEVRTSIEMAEDVANASITLEVPAGTTLVPNSVLLDGEPVSGSMQPDGYVVELGDLATGDAHVLRHRVLAGEDLVGGERVQLASTFHADDHDDALIGRASVLVESITLIAPTRTTTRTILLSGRAPAGEAVRLFAGAAEVGQAVAGPGGMWRTTVTLPDAGRTARYQLRAEVTTPAGVSTSRTHAVQLDASQPALLSLTMGQEPEGRTVTIPNPQAGVPAFPYVFVPSQPLVIGLTFDVPEAVDDVVVHVAGEEFDAELEDGVWTAEFFTYRLDGMRVTWEIIDRGEPTGLELLTEEQVRNRVPATMADFTATFTPGDSEDGLSNSMQVELPDAGVDMDIDITVEDAPSDYEPSAEELAKANADGHPIYDVDWTYDDTYDPDSETALDTTVEFYVPASELASTVEAARFSAASLSVNTTKAFNPFGLFKKVKTHVKAGGLEDNYKGMTQLSDLQQATGAGDKYARMDKLRKWAESCPPNGIEAEVAEQVLDRIQRFAEHGAPAADATSASLSAGGLAVDPGPGKNPFIFLTQLAAGAIQDRGVNDQFDQMESMLQGVDCTPPPDDEGSGESSSDSTGGDGGSDGGGSGGGGVNVPVTPIYDPSGYVYEGYPSNRLEGVTATILYRESDDDLTPELWDAEWFGQENPHETNPEGRYGWDVPEGWWQVVWTADGYETGYSDILEVLPPRFDVNHGMVSLEAPTFASATATTSGVTLAFDKPMLVESVLDVVTVQHGDTVVTGSVAADTPQDVGGQGLATTFTFTPASPIAGGTTLSVTVEREAQGYNQRSLTSTTTRAATVPAVTGGGGDEGGGTGGGSGGGGGGGGGTTSNGTVTVVPGGRALVVRTDAGDVRILLAGATGGQLAVHVESASATPGLTLLPTSFDVTSTSTFDEAEVCFPYDEAEVAAAGLSEGELRLFHGLADGTYEDITTSVDTTANVICGMTDHFSPFVVGASRSTRIAGADRYATAAAASAATFEPGVPVAYLASGSSFADALAAGPAAAKAGGPVLLTTRDSIPAATAAEIERLRPSKIVVVGGTAAVSDAVLASVRSLAATVERVAGADRYATARTIAERSFADAGVVYVATGTSFADALAAGPLAAADGAPVLLVAPGAVGAAARRIGSLQPDRIIVVGGTAAVSEDVVSQLRRSAGDDVVVERLAGTDRYETAAVIARRLGTSTVFLATGEAFADALAGVPVVVANGGAILLVRPGSLPAAAATLLDAMRPDAITVLGGTAAVGRGVELAAARSMP